VQAAKLGYTNLYVYGEGMPVWEEQNYPMVKGPGYEAKIETNLIIPAQLHNLLKANKAEVVVVDVRDKYEYDEGHIPGAIYIPAATFAAGSGVLDKKKKIVVYCNAGGRSYKAYRKLMQLGYKNIYQALFTDWKTAGLPVEKK
jgi:rhodanese-related sulfurtransferase